MRYTFTYPSITIIKYQDATAYYWEGKAVVRGKTWTMRLCESVEKVYLSKIPIDYLDQEMERKLILGLHAKVRELDVPGLDINSFDEALPLTHV